VLLSYHKESGSLFKTTFQKLLNHFCKEKLLKKKNTRIIFIGVLQFQLCGEPSHQSTKCRKSTSRMGKNLLIEDETVKEQVDIGDPAFD
jgi:siderophore synthetase component